MKGPNAFCQGTGWPESGVGDQMAVSCWRGEGRGWDAVVRALAGERLGFCPTRLDDDRVADHDQTRFAPARGTQRRDVDDAFTRHAVDHGPFLSVRVVQRVAALDVAPVLEVDKDLLIHFC